LFFPLRDQIGIRVVVLQKPIVQRLRDGFLFVVEVVDVSCACATGVSLLLDHNFHSEASRLLTLMADLEDGPQSLVALLALVWRVLCILHLVGKLEKSVFDVFEAIRWRFAITGGARRWHIRVS
jgi:hypothetical protein